MVHFSRSSHFLSTNTGFRSWRRVRGKTAPWSPKYCYHRKLDTRYPFLSCPAHSTGVCHCLRRYITILGQLDGTDDGGGGLVEQKNNVLEPIHCFASGVMNCNSPLHSTPSKPVALKSPGATRYFHFLSTWRDPGFLEPQSLSFLSLDSYATKGQKENLSPERDSNYVVLAVL